jgi:asparagine synthase (glutamine-hydrolysing)
LRASNEPQRRIIRECNPELSAIMTDRGYGEQEIPLVAKFFEAYYYALFKIDYTYLFALPHWLTRIDTMCHSVIGRTGVLGAQKFEGYRLWFRDELSSYVRDILLDRRSLKRPYWNKKVLEEMVSKHTRGTHNYMHEINKAMTMEFVHRTMIDQ